MTTLVRGLGLTPANDPVATLVYHAHAGDVDTVMVDGRVLVRNGKVSGVDEDAMLSAAEHASHRAWSRFAQRHGAYVAPAP